MEGVEGQAAQAYELTCWWGRKLPDAPHQSTLGKAQVRAVTSTLSISSLIRRAPFWDGLSSVSQLKYR